MKINMKILRWILLILYIAIIIGLLGMTYYHGENLQQKLLSTIILFITTVIAQTVFILGIGTADLCTPVTKRRLIIPVIIAAVMMTALIAGITLALGELIFNNQGEWFAYVFWSIVAITWLAWGLIFFLWGTKTQRYNTLRNFVSTMFAGSLLSLMISIPSHIIVSKRPGCLVGLGTGLGIYSGVIVMFWAFGPGIILLFLREIRKAQLLRNANGNK